MIKKVSVLVITGLTFLSFQFNDLTIKENSWDYLNLNGKVKSVRQIKYKPGPDTSRIYKGSNPRRMVNVFLLSLSEDFHMDNSLVKFSKKGRITEWIDYNSSREPEDTLTFIYSKDSKLPDKIVQKIYGKTAFTIRYKYDTKNRKKKSMYIGSRRELKALHDYSEKKKIKDEFIFNKNSTVMTYKKINDTEVASNFYSADNELMKSDTMIFNNQNNVTRKGRVSFEYKYDDQGNWIVRKEYANDKLQYIYERKIAYY